MIVDGNSNTRFFHSCVKANRRRNQISEVSVDGAWIQDVASVKSEVRRNFQERYKEAEVRRPVLDDVSFLLHSSEENISLTKPFSEEEVREAIWCYNDNKSPGSDRFDLSFIKECWDMGEKDVLNFISEFISNSKLTKAILCFLIALVPRKDRSQSLEEYRPISIIASIYKILAKVLDVNFKGVGQGNL